MHKLPLYIAATTCLLFSGCRQLSDVSSLELRAQIAQLKADKAKLELKNTQVQQELERHTRRENRRTCINHLRMIDGAKEKWAMANNKENGALPAASDVSPYINNGFRSLRCAESGAYSIDPIGRGPRCNVAGHELNNTQVLQHFERHTRLENQRTCIINLRMIDGAKDMWAITNAKESNALPAASDISPYIKNGFRSLRCPDSGAYSIDRLGRGPRCNVAGHELPK
jgi:hypothetical protein